MPDTVPRRAVFLDRDGTIAEEVGYLNHLSRFHLYPYSAAAIRRLNQAGVPAIVVTNQSGASRGYFPESLIPQVHEKMISNLAAAGARVDGVYYCPHRNEDNCTCRKPRLGMLERAAREHNLTIPGSFVVGDRYTEIELAHNAACRSIFLLSGYGRGDYEWHHSRWAHQPHHVVESLVEAVDIILKELP